MASNMKPGERQNIYRGQRLVGFIDRTQGGFYRGYNFSQSLGCGPFYSFETALAFVHQENPKK